MWEAAREEERKIPWKEANEGPLVPEEQKRFWRRRVDAGLLSEVEMARAWTKTQQCISSPCTNRLHYSHSDFNKTTKQKIGPPADAFIVTSKKELLQPPPGTLGPAGPVEKLLFGNMFLILHRTDTEHSTERSRVLDGFFDFGLWSF